MIIARKLKINKKGIRKGFLNNYIEFYINLVYFIKAFDRSINITALFINFKYIEKLGIIYYAFTNIFKASFLIHLNLLINFFFFKCKVYYFKCNHNINNQI